MKNWDPTRHPSTFHWWCMLLLLLAFVYSLMGCKANCEKIKQSGKYGWLKNCKTGIVVVTSKKGKVLCEYCDTTPCK